MIIKGDLVDDSKICDQEAHRRLFNECVLGLLRGKLNASLYKRILVRAPSKLLTKMSNPLVLADFLTSSYNRGGLVSILALNGLFILINKYNL
jgi:U3 small nucleolar RNA-associated protein 19